MQADVGIDDLPAVHCDLAGCGNSFVEFGVFLRHLRKGLLEYRNVVLYAEAHVGVMVECPVAGFVDVGGLQGNRFVSVFLGHLDPAIPVAVLYICSAEDDEAGFEFLNIDEEGHEAGFFLCGICV